MMFTIQAKWEEATPRIHAICAAAEEADNLLSGVSASLHTQGQTEGVKKGKLIESLNTEELTSLPH